MAFVVHRRLAIPLWGIAFLAVALTAPPPGTVFRMPPGTAFALALVGIGLITFFMVARAIPWLRPSRVRALAEPNRRKADDALDCARMDDDGGRQRR